MAEEEAKVKPEERCGHGWLRGISYGWGKHLTACRPIFVENPMFPGGCFHTGTTPPEGPTWKFNLDKPYYVHYFAIQNRRDCCWGRLNGMKVYVGDENYNTKYK